MADEVKYFVLLKGGKDTEHIYSGKQPRQAALKAASDGNTDIKLHERGTKKIHIFKGSIDMVDAPANAPSWLKVVNGKIKKPNVQKIGIERIK